MARVDLAERQGGGGAAQVVVEEATFILPLEGVIDLDAERARLTKAIAAAEKERDALAGRLATPASSNAPSPKRWRKRAPITPTRRPKPTRLQAALGRLG